MSGPPKTATEDVRGDIASPARCEQRRASGGTTRRSQRSRLHQDREVLLVHLVTIGGSAPKPRVKARGRGRASAWTSGCGDRRSWRFAVKRSFIWWVHSASGSAGLPGSPTPSCRGLRPRMSRHTRVVTRRKTGAAREGATGNRTIRWCSWRESVAEVGETHLSRHVTWDVGLATARRLAKTNGEIARGDEPCLWRGRQRFAASNRVRGETTQVNNKRVEPARVARLGSSRWKALWSVRSPPS